MSDQTNDPAELYVVLDSASSPRQVRLTQAVAEKNRAELATYDPGAHVTAYVPKSELLAARARIEELEALVAGSAPLAWVAGNDMDGARAWEVRAADVLGWIEVDHG